MTARFAVNVSGMVSSWLRADSQVTALFGDRIYTVLPNQEADTFPVARVQRIAGSPVSPEAALDEAVIQIDVWGDRFATAHTAAEEIRRSLWDLVGRAHNGVLVSNVRFGFYADNFDDERVPPRPRVIVEAVLTTRPEPV